MLASYIASNLATVPVDGSGSWAVGTNVFHGGELPPDGDIPEEAIFVVQTEGEEDDYLKGETAAIRYDAWVVTYRTAPDVWNNGKTVADALFSTIHRKRDLSGYFNVVVLSSAPAPLQAQKRMARWALSVRGSKRVA